MVCDDEEAELLGSQLGVAGQVEARPIVRNLVTERNLIRGHGLHGVTNQGAPITSL